MYPWIGLPHRTHEEGASTLWRSTPDELAVRSHKTDRVGGWAGIAIQALLLRRLRNERAFGGNEQGMRRQRKRERYVSRCWTGEFGRNHARVYREIQDAELVGVFDKSTDARKLLPLNSGRTPSLLSTNCAPSGCRQRGRAYAEPAEMACRLMEMGLKFSSRSPWPRACGGGCAAGRGKAISTLAADRPRRTIQPAVLAVEPILNHSAFFRGAPAGSVYGRAVSMST